MGEPKIESGHIFSLIPKIMREVGAVGKNGRNKQGGFTYEFRSIDDVYNHLHPVLADNGVFFMPEVIESDEKQITSKSGTAQIRVRLKVRYRIYAEDGSMLETTVQGEAIDASDKATNKALTAAFKYMAIQVFCLAVKDLEDADNHSPDLGKPKQVKQKAAAAAPKAKTEKPPNPFVQPAKSKGPGSYIIPFGQHEGKTLASLGPELIQKHVAQIMSSGYEPTTKEAKQKLDTYLKQAELFLNQKPQKHAQQEEYYGEPEDVPF